MTDLDVVEICAGAGGQALGLERAGFAHALAMKFADHRACNLELYWGLRARNIRRTYSSSQGTERFEAVCGSRARSRRDIPRTLAR